MKAKIDGQAAANRMCEGVDPLKDSWETFKKGAVENGCPEPLIAFMEFGFWMGANANMTRALWMVGQDKEGVADMKPANLMTEIDEGLQNLNTAQMFKPFKPK